MAFSPGALTELATIHGQFWNTVEHPKFPVTTTLPRSPRFAHFVGADAVRAMTWSVDGTKGLVATWDTSIHTQPVEVTSKRSDFKPTELSDGVLITTIPPKERFNSDPTRVSYRINLIPGTFCIGEDSRHSQDGREHPPEELLLWCAVSEQGLARHLNSVLDTTATRQVYDARHSIRQAGTKIAEIGASRTFADGQLVSRGLHIALRGVSDLELSFGKTEDPPELLKITHKAYGIPETSGANVSEYALDQAIFAGRLIVDNAAAIVSEYQRRPPSY